MPEMQTLDRRNTAVRRHGARGLRPRVGPGAACGLKALLAAFLCLPAGAAVVDVTVADVTTRSFSVVWASSEPVTAASVRVFSDAAGSAELTPGLGIALVSSAFPPALALGVVKVAVTGVAPETCVYVQTQTVGASGTVLEPAAAPFREVCTAAHTTRASATDQVIANDLLSHPVFAPGSASPALGALVLVRVPGVGAYPLSAFVGEGGFDPPAAVVDLNNLFDPATRRSADVPSGARLEIVEFRGLRCPALEDHQLLRFRRVPAHEEVAQIGRRLTELEAPAPCFFADVVCDGTVNILDAQRLLNVFGAVDDECAFNPDFDIVADGVVNILDVQSVLNRLGQAAP
jgi:hypothetical protein